MGSSASWVSDEEIAEQEKQNADARDKFQKTVMGWYDAVMAGNCRRPVRLTVPGYRMVEVIEEPPPPTTLFRHQGSF